MLKFLWALILLALIASCTGANKTKNQNHLNIPLQTSISTLDPAICYNEICRQAISQSYETLLEYEYKTRPYKLKPLLATSLPSVSKDGLIYIFQIKPKTYFQKHNYFKDKPLREVTAKDFITQIKRVAFKPTQSKGWWLFDNNIKGLNEFRENAKTMKDFINMPVSGLDAPDKYTLKITLTKPNAQFIYAFAMDFTTPIPIEAIEALDNDLSRQTIATGPFILQKWIPSSRVEYIKNPNYRVEYYPGTKERLPFVDSYTAHIIKEAPTRWLNFAKNKIDFLELDKDDHELAINAQGELKPELAQKGITRHLSNSLTYWWISFNMEHPILGKNLNLRKAIAHAIDREKFIELFTSNLGLKANSIYAPGILGHKAEKWPIQYSPEKSRNYLKKAGLNDNQLVFNFDLRNTDSKRRQMGDFFQSQLSKVGIKLNIIPNTFPAYLKKAREGKLELFLDGWIMDYPDPENSLQLLYSQNKTPGPNVTSYQNNDFDRKFLAYKKANTKAEKTRLLNELDQIIRNDLPWHMMFYSRYNTLVHKRVKNYEYSDVITNFIKYLKLQ